MRSLGGATLLASPALILASDDEVNCPASTRRDWVAECLKRILTIEVGMNRQQLSKVFTTEGGLFNAMRRTYVSRDCLLFKVDVTFRRATESTANDDRSELFHELDDDVITSVSRPYLQFSITD